MLPAFNTLVRAASLTVVGAQQERPLPLMRSLGVKMRHVLIQSARCSEASPNSISLERHPFFTERTHRSAKAFRSGERGGGLGGFTPPSRIDRNPAQNFACAGANISDGL